MGKPTICIGENKDADQLAVTAKLISAFVFATRIVQFLFYLNPKFQASSSFVSDLDGNHIVGFPTRRLKFKHFNNAGGLLEATCTFSAWYTAVLSAGAPYAVISLD